MCGARIVWGLWCVRVVVCGSFLFAGVTMCGGCGVWGFWYVGFVECGVTVCGGCQVWGGVGVVDCGGCEVCGLRSVVSQCSSQALLLPHTLTPPH